MPDKPMSPEEIERNQNTLRYIKPWLRHREMTQRRLAELMGVSEPTVSKWLRGVVTMSVGQFTQIAQILDAKPEDLLFAPDEQGAAARYREAAELVKAMTKEELQAWISVGKAITKK